LTQLLEESTVPPCFDLCLVPGTRYAHNLNPTGYGPTALLLSASLREPGQDRSGSIYEREVSADGKEIHQFGEETTASSKTTYVPRKTDPRRRNWIAQLGGADLYSDGPF
jgi:hypothetical protein